MWGFLVRKKRSLRMKFSVAIAILSLTIGFLITFSGYQLYNQHNIEMYSERGEALVEATGERINWDKISSYAVSLVKDEEYYETLNEMRTLARSGGVEYLYVLYPIDEDGAIYIYDSDESDDRCELGDYTKWEAEFGDSTEALLRGEEVDPFIADSEWGQLLSIYEPFYDSTGRFAGYLGVDYPAERLIAERNTYISELALGAVGIAIVITLIFLVLFRRLVLNPLNTIVHAAENYSIVSKDGTTQSSDSIKELEIHTKDELQVLGKSLKYMDATIRDYIENLERATKRAETDSLTGLMNRESFMTQVMRIVVHDKPDASAFLMIDIDDFKGINDSYGHSVGDEVLEYVALEIKSAFRTGDLVARMGGDEFAVFCHGQMTRDNIEKRVENLISLVRNSRVRDTIRLSISIGVVFAQGVEIPSSQTLYSQADMTLYRVKDNGRDGYVIMNYEQKRVQ